MTSELSTLTKPESEARAVVFDILKEFSTIYMGAYRKKYEIDPPSWMTDRDEQQEFVMNRTVEIVDLFVSSIKGYRKAELMRGLSRLDEYPEWPPNIKQYLLLCRPKPDHAKAYKEAIDGMVARGRGEIGRWSHPAIFWAASPMRFELQSKKWEDIKEDWKAALDIQMEMGQWEAIPKPDLQIGMSPSPNNKQNCEQLMRDLGIGQMFKRKTDELAWAHDVLKNPNATATMIRMAKDALNVKDDL